MTLAERLAKNIQAELTPMVWGPPGSGKTAVAFSLEKVLNRKVIYIPIGGKQPEDIAGYLINDEQSTSLQLKWPWWVEMAFDLKDAIVVFDEYGSAAPETQAVSLSIIQERRIGKYTFPEGTSMMGMGNPPHQAAGGHVMSAPMASRFIHIYHEANAKEWAEGALTRWGKGHKNTELAQAYASVASFINVRPNLILQVPDEAEDAAGAWPNYRTWEAVAKSLPYFGPDEEQVIGCVGKGAAKEFLVWYKEQDLPNPETVLQQAASFPLPKVQDKFQAVMSSLTALVSVEPKKYWHNLWVYYERALNEKPNLTYPFTRKLVEIGESANLNVPPATLKLINSMQKDAKIL